MTALNDVAYVTQQMWDQAQDALRAALPVVEEHVPPLSTAGTMISLRDQIRAAIVGAPKTFPTSFTSNERCIVCGAELGFGWPFKHCGGERCNRPLASTERLSDMALRNVRAWASARPNMSGSQAIVDAIDELLERRRAVETSDDCPVCHSRLGQSGVSIRCANCGWIKSNTASGDAQSPAGALSEVASPYTADNGDSKGVAADDTRQALRDTALHALTAAHSELRLLGRELQELNDRVIRSPTALLSPEVMEIVTGAIAQLSEKSNGEPT